MKKILITGANGQLGKSLERIDVILCSLYLPSLHPGAAQRVLPHTLQNIGPDLPDIFLSPCRKIQIPSPVQVMKFRSPDVFTHFSAFMSLPDRDLTGILKSHKGV